MSIQSRTAAPNLVQSALTGFVKSLQGWPFILAMILFAFSGAIYFFGGPNIPWWVDKGPGSLAFTIQVFNWGQQSQIEAQELSERSIREAHDRQVTVLRREHGQEVDGIRTNYTIQISNFLAPLQNSASDLAACLTAAQAEGWSSDRIFFPLGMVKNSLFQSVSNLSELCGADPATIKRKKDIVGDLLARQKDLEDSAISTQQDAQGMIEALQRDRSAANVDHIISGLSKIADKAGNLAEGAKGASEVAIDLDDRIATAVACPYCAKENNVLIGTLQGATSCPVCESCEKPFYVHRKKDGQIKTNKMPDAANKKEGVVASAVARSAPGPTLYIPLSCPNPGCDERFNVATFEHTQRQEERGCFGCGALMLIDHGARCATLIAKKDFNAGRIVDETLVCDMCDKLTGFSTRREDSLAGFCKTCKAVVRALAA